MGPSCLRAAAAPEDDQLQDQLPDQLPDDLQDDLLVDGLIPEDLIAKALPQEDLLLEGKDLEYDEEDPEDELEGRQCQFKGGEGAALDALQERLLLEQQAYRSDRPRRDSQGVTYV